MSINTQLAIIGAGPGGYPAAFRAADLGIRVTLIDREKNPGGECLYRGCIPSKALLHIASILSESRNAEKIGITYNDPSIDLKKVVQWKDQIINKLTSGAGFLVKKRKINYIRGTAIFANSKTIKVTKENGLEENGLEETVNFENCIIATGSRPADIPGIKVDNKKIINSEGALDLESVPEELLVIGGGYIGLEMGTVYASLGSNVTVVEMLDSIIESADKDLSNVLYKKLNKEFSSILLDTKVTEVRNTNKGVKVKFENNNDGKFEREFNKVLISTGRQPNSEGIGLENTRVKVNSMGFIETDRQKRTYEPNIYAVGDVAGEPMLAHKATHEGRVAAEVIAGQNVIYDVSAVPAVVFTDPEIAWCGLTEKEAKQNNIDVKVTKFPWGASGRAMTLNKTDGLTKIIFDSKTERLLGVGIAGTGAGELISEGVLGVEMATLASDISLSVHPHPTLTETFMEAAEMFYGNSTHFMK